MRKKRKENKIGNKMINNLDKNNNNNNYYYCYLFCRFVKMQRERERE